jgi:peroxiredoxin
MEAVLRRIAANQQSTTYSASTITNLYDTQEITNMSHYIRIAVATLLAVGAYGQTPPPDPSGRWSATIEKGKTTVPFRLDISVSGGTVTGKLFNGLEDFETTSSATLNGNSVRLNFDHYLTSIQADLKDGELDGQLVLARRSGINITPGAERDNAHDVVSKFHAVRYSAEAKQTEAANVPQIDGVWELPHESPKGEKAWRLIVKQRGSDISASVLRVDGDTGAFTGGWRDGKFSGSHFDGARPGLIEITPQSDGTLKVQLNAEPRNFEFTAYRPEVARAKGFPEPANYATHTAVRDASEVFSFSFPDIHGKTVSNDDARFKGKVVLAIVTGTWCPNCHDEARYLVQLYGKYHDQGLEIVALDFEEADQLQSLTRVNAFIKQYQVPYTYLVAGTPDEMWQKIPQAVNLNTWPATLFIGRDGHVKATYSGFAGSASGVYNDQLKDYFTTNIEKLLREGTSAQTAALR